METRIVLVRPRNPLNMGAAARAMANFGLKDLVVVHPYAAAWREARSAVGAEEVLRTARQLPLAEAVEDCALVLGTTTGRRRSLLQPVVPLPRLKEHLAETLGAVRARVAVLFGSEKTGLTNRELGRCHALVRIPTRPETPSMNLSHALAVVAYELARPGSDIPVTRPGFALPTEEQLEDLVERTMRALGGVGYMQHMPAGTRREKLRRAFRRWGMTRADAALLQAVFKRVSERLGSAARKEAG